jgi:hypothetical protein
MKQESAFYLNICGAFDDKNWKNYITPNIWKVVVNINYFCNGILHRKMGRHEEILDNNKLNFYFIVMLGKVEV